MPLAAVAQAPPGAIARTQGPRIQPELRIDAFFAERDAVHLGFGGVVPAGNYVRIAALAGAGVARGEAEGDDTRASGRAELVARFLFDPLRQSRWGVYAGAGGAAHWVDGADWRGALVLLLGVEGPPRGGMMVAAEAGLGGGARVGVAIRRARPLLR